MRHDWFEFIVNMDDYDDLDWWSDKRHADGTFVVDYVDYEYRRLHFRIDSESLSQR